MKWMTFRTITVFVVSILAFTSVVDGDGATSSSEYESMKQVFHLKLLLNIPPSEAFTWFTVNERLESWLTEVAEVEPKIGGKYELFWDPNDRENNSTIGCRVTALTPNQLLAFDWKSFHSRCTKSG